MDLNNVQRASSKSTNIISLFHYLLTIRSMEVVESDFPATFSRKLLTKAKVSHQTLDHPVK